MASDIHPSVQKVYERFSANHFSRYLGLELISASEEEVVVGLPVREDHLQNVGFVHGGVLATLADVAMGFAAVARTSPDNHVLTGDLRVSYLNPGLGPYLYVRGYAVKAGRRLVFTEGEVYREVEGVKTLVCRASATMVVVAKEDVQGKR